MEVINEAWSPQLKIVEIMLTVLQLLREPNDSHPLRPDVAEKYKNDRSGFTKTAKDWTKKHAK
jgi:ubiquitin-conjugating enzyme E2 D/E